MSIVFAENFSRSTVDSTVWGLLGMSRYVGPYFSAPTLVSPPASVDPERRNCLSWAYNPYEGSGTGYFWIGIPLPVSNDIYVSMRLSVPSHVSQTVGTFYPLYMSMDINSSYQPMGGNTVARVDTAGGAYVGPELTSLLTGFKYNTMFNLELRLKITGEYGIWMNNALVAQGNNLFISSSRKLWIGSYRTTYVAGNTIIRSYLNDIIVIDATKPGLQNRVGPTARVTDVIFDGDNLAEWDLTSSTGLTKNYQVANSTLATNPTSHVAASIVGQTDLFDTVPLDPALGPKIHGLLCKSYARNMGGASHSIGSVVKLGDTLSNYGSAILTPGSGYAINNFDLSINPSTGNIWTIAELADAKIGYKVID